MLGVLTRTEALRTWADEHQVPCLDGRDALLEATDASSFDLLWSIDNPWILPAPVLARPKTLAINYHDGPLPRYAGVHATSWAILARERWHAITWHVMDETIDGGDILVQVPLPIAPDATARSLDLACWQAAFVAFLDLLGDLERGTWVRKPQRTTDRTYFGPGHRPPGGCTLDFSRDAAELDALVRALDFGDGPNPLGTPKVAVGPHLLSCKRLWVGARSTLPPGSLVALEPDALVVATSTRDVRLEGLSTLEGAPVRAGELAAALDPGQPRVGLDRAAFDRLGAQHRRVCAQERRFVRRLARAQPLVVPGHATIGRDPSPRSRESSPDAPQPPSAARRSATPPVALPTADGTLALLAVASVLGRAGGTTTFDVGLRHPAITEFDPSLFAPVVPLRIDLQGSASVAHNLDTLARALSELVAAGTYPRDLVARHPELRHLGGEGPTYFVSVHLVDAAHPPDAIDAPFAVVIDVDARSLHVDHDPSRVSDVAAHAWARRIAEHARALAEDPGRSLDDVPLLPPDERAAMLALGRGPRLSRSDAAVTRAILRHATLDPERPAVEHDGHRLTRRALVERAHAASATLAAHGVGPGAIVAVCLPRGMDLPVTMLAVWLCGACHLALDPEQPDERLSALLRHVEASFVCARRSELVRLASEPAERRRFAVEDLFVPRGPSPVRVIAPEDPAYVIYTSGSTGHPKGVVIPHRALSAHLASITEAYALSPDDRILQFASPGFDVAIEEIVGALATGATLVVRPDHLTTDFAAFTRFVRKARLSVLNLPTAWWRAWVDHLHRRHHPLPASLRLVVIGTEQVARRPVEQWRDLHGSDRVRLLNCYGPTEATVGATSYIVPARGPLPERIPIGRPLSGTVAWVLSRDREPLPAGVPGELFLGGPRLAQGYLRAPGPTAEAFVSDPHRSGQRLYRTGDLAQWNALGELEYLGRIDRQLKIRGHRIEPAEIEAVLLEQPTIRRAVVNAVPGPRGEPSLVAWLEPAEGAPLDRRALRRALQARLPAAMIPTRFVGLQRMPLGPTGKIDPSALPMPAWHELDDPPVPPRTPLEQQLLQAFAAALGTPESTRLSIRDDFFACGGHSLAAARLVEEIERRIGVAIGLSELFNHPTVEALADRLVRDPPVASHGATPLVARRQRIIAVREGGDRPPLFHVGGAFLLRELAAHLRPGRPIYGVLEQSLDDAAALDLEVDTIALRCLADIRATQPHGPYALAGWCFGGRVALEVARHLARQGERVALLALIDSYGPRRLRPGVREQLERLRHHRRRLRGRPPADVLVDLGVRVVGRAWSKIWPRLYLGTRGLGRQPPAWLRSIEQANLAAADRHDPRPYDGPVVLLRAEDQPRWERYGPRMGWSGILTGVVAQHTLPGDHLGLYDPPHVAALATHLDTYLDATVDPPLQSRTA